SGRSTDVLLTVPESSTKAIGRAPRLLAGGGGQSWLVGYSPPRAPSPGVQASPSLGPALHLLLVGSQIGHDWMNVLQLPLGQSAFVMEPRLAFAPPTQAAVSQVPELSGTFRPVVEPVLQSAVPAALAVIVLMTQLLVAAPWWERFGIGSGGPNRQPAFVHCRNLHVPPGQSAFVVQALWWFEPPAQRLPPASVGEVPLRVSAVPVHAALLNDFPWSGTVEGSGTPTPAPPK